MFTNSRESFQQSRLLAVDYPTLRSGAAAACHDLQFGRHIPRPFTVVPAVTYSATEPTLYAPKHYSSARS